MSDLLLGAITFAVALSAVLIIHARTRRHAPAADGTTGSLLAEPDRHTGGSREFASLADPNAWQSATVSDLSTAEELLDRAEAAGYRERELIVLGEALFLVRWRGRA
jgi:hypothetical protein